jgi:hypothetical protein
VSFLPETYLSIGARGASLWGRTLGRHWYSTLVGVDAFFLSFFLSFFFLSSSAWLGTCSDLVAYCGSSVA